MPNRLEALNPTQRKMVACSLEIDGRVARAAEAVVGGHVSEFIYAGYLDRPVSPKAVELEELKAELEAEIARVGIDALVEELRTPRPAVPTEAEKARTHERREELAKEAGYSTYMYAHDDVKKRIAQQEAAEREAAEREAAGLARLLADAEASRDAEIEAQVAAFSAALNAPSKPLVFTIPEFDGRPGFQSVPCDSCFGRGRRDWPFVGPVRVTCFRCDGAGYLAMNQAMIDAKLTPVPGEPTQDPADLDDDEPTADRARVWDEAADAFRNYYDLPDTFPISNPYAAPDTEPCGYEIAGATLEDPAEYCETPADECTRHDS